MTIEPRWVEDGGDGMRLMWGHIKVGSVYKGSGGTWYAYYRATHSRSSMESLRDFATDDLARAAVEAALKRAAQSVA
jgi:hypothetical protein